MACQALEFARAQWANGGDEADEKEKIKRSRWHRTVIWELVDFKKNRKEGDH